LILSLRTPTVKQAWFLPATLLVKSTGRSDGSSVEENGGPTGPALEPGQSTRPIQTVGDRAIDKRPYQYQSLKALQVKLSRRLFGLAWPLVLFVIPTILCGRVAGFQGVLQMWLFLLAAIVPVVIGGFIINRYFKHNQKLAFVLHTGLIGFVFFEVALVGMLIDERSANFSWQYELSVAAIAGAVAVIVVIVNYLFRWLFRQ
jgi:hypothetical protein